MNVLILGARAPALNGCEPLKNQGGTVSVGDSLSKPLSRFSRSVQHYIGLPEPRQNPTAWGEALETAMQNQHFDLLLPTCEEVFYLAHCLKRLLPLDQVLTSGFSLLHLLSSRGN